MQGVATFAAALAAASLLAMNAGPSMRRTALALVCNWLVCMAAVAVTGRVDPWLLFAIIDVVTAFVVLLHPATRPQAVIGVLYVVQLMFHFAYAMAGSGPATGVYLNLLTGGGWLQIAVLAGGSIYGSGKRRAACRDLGGDSAPVIAGHSRRVEAGG